MLYEVITKEDGEFVSHHYADDGDGYGAYRVDTYHLKRTGDQVLIRRHTEGSYPPEPRMKLVLHGGSTQQIEADGEVVPFNGEAVILPSSEIIQFGLQ